MDKKFLIGLLAVSLIVFAGGCGGSSHSVTGSTDVNEALSGAWTASADGTASITSTDSDDLSDIEALIGSFEELSSEVLENIGVLIGENPNTVKEKYEEEKKKGIAETVNVPVTSAMAIFEDCDISNNKGSAKLSAIVILSDDSLYLPVFYNGTAISTQRNGTNKWIATTSEGDTLSITMASDEKMILSGKVNYLGYVCEFNTVMDKNTPNSINPQEILDGTWNLSGDQGGGYLASGSKIIVSAAPEKASIFFSGTNSQPSIKSFYSLRMRSSGNESYDETSLLQNITEGSGTLTNIYGNAYKLTGTDGSESIIFIENTDEIFVFMLDGDACMFLPLKKVSIDAQTALNKTWTASEGMGGGYVLNFQGNSEEIKQLNSLGAFSFSLTSATLKFSGVTVNDDAVAATVALDSSFSFTNENLEKLGISVKDLSIPIKVTQQVTMERSGNFLQFNYDDDVYKISFISDKEAFLFVTPDSNNATGEFVIRFTAN